MALLLPRRKAGAVDISTVFSTDLYTGNGSTQTITNGIDLSGEGGLVWIKSRSTATDNYLTDTERGASQNLFSNSTQGQVTSPTSINSFLSDGFDLLGSSNNNVNTRTYASWTFRKSPNFFDVVTFSGTGAQQDLAHNLGVEPGLIIMRSYTHTKDWWVWHRSIDGQASFLNLTNASASVPTWTGHTASTFKTIDDESGKDYVAYLFSHDPTDNGVIQCGSYTGNGSASGPTVTLGWEPQWVMIKNASNFASWYIWDDQRDATDDRTVILYPNQSAAEDNSTNYSIEFTTTGFQVKTNFSEINASTQNFIYVAIRKEGV